MSFSRTLLGYLNPAHALHRLVVALRNWHRRRFTALDYILLAVPTSLPALPPDLRWWQRLLPGDPPLSLWELGRTFDRIAADPRPRGVILYLRTLDRSLADLQTLRDLIARLRARGKRVVCFAVDYTLPTYYVACAADEIVLQRGGSLQTIGLYGEVVFMRDALATVGLQADVVQISPYKSALDPFSRDDISPEMREMFDWLFDSRYQLIVDAIAAGRQMSAADARVFVDGAPYVDDAALGAGYVDAITTQEGLAAFLGVQHIVDWHQAVSKLPVRWRDRVTPKTRYIAVLPLSGMQIEGESRKSPADLPVPLLGGELMGSLTVVQQVRRLMADEQAAAVVLHVDSQGGAESGAYAMVTALRELSQDRPVITYMNGVAASGGYFVSTPARWIVAQPGTITGSIGVLAFKLNGAGLIDRLRLNPVTFLRGANAAMYSSGTPWNDTQRQRVRDFIEHSYTRFVADVAAARHMTVEAVDAVAGGRVWTGAQALEHGLIDQLGGLDAAIQKARDMAGLPQDAPVRFVRGKGQPLGPQAAEALNAQTLFGAVWGLLRARHRLEMLFNGLPQRVMPFDVK